MTTHTTKRIGATAMLVASSAGVLSLIASPAASAQVAPAVASGSSLGRLSSASVVEVEVANPAAPTISTVAALPKAVSVSWAAPADQTGGAVLAYHVMALKAGSIKSQQIVSADVHQTALDGLANGTEYDVIVLPYTSTGAGVASIAVKGTPDAEADPAVAAASITGLSTLKGLGFITASWNAPVTDGGSPIVGYSVIAVDQAAGTVAAWRNVRADLRSASLTGLAGGKTYDVYVIADTALGFGGIAAPVHVALAAGSLTLPKTATMTWANAIPVGDNAVVSFGPAAEHGEQVTKYHVVVIQNDEMTAWKAVDASQRQVVVPLAGTGTAQVYVFAESASGFGAALDPISVHHA